MISRSRNAEQLIDGKPDLVLTNGVVSQDFLHNRTLGTSEMFQQLRHKGIEHLGQLACVYIENDGMVTVFRGNEVRPGLPITPPWELEQPVEYRAGETGPADKLLSCLRCGTTMEPLDHIGNCPHCGHDRWTEARTELRYKHD